MKNIIVPTDFSANANNALDYAIQIANYFEGTIHLVHAYEVSSTNAIFIGAGELLLEGAEKELKKIEAHYEDRLFPKTTFETRSLEGPTATQICTNAKTVAADLIIMGTQGASGLKEIFLGSNTAAVVRRSHTPVLVVPNRFSYEPMKRISLAIDDDILADDSILNPLLQLAEAYKAKIDLLHVFKERIPEAVDMGVVQVLKNIPHQSFNVKHENVNEGINYFVKESKADLLCMIKRERSFLERLFHSSVTRKEVFNSPVPLLLLPEE